MNLLIRAAVSASSIVAFGCGDQQPTNLKPAVEVAVIEPTAGNTAVNAAAYASLPAYRDPVVQEWARYNSSCRGSASDKDACRARDTLTAKVEARGWCYGRGPGGGLDWVACDGPSPNNSATRTNRHSAHPEHGGGEVDEGEVVAREPVEACCEAAEVFELVEAALDAVAEPIDQRIVWDRALA